MTTEWEDETEDELEEQAPTPYADTEAESRKPDWSGLVGGAIGLFMVLLTIWGIGWSFYRHGPVHGIASVLLPPYAWYRGIAFLWDTPSWKEDWDEKTETIGAIIIMSTDKESGLSGIRYKNTARKWIDSLPKREKSDLRKAVDGFGDACTMYSRNLTQDMLLSSRVRPITDPSVEAFVSKFSMDKGLMRAWGQIKSQDKTARATLEKLIADCPPEKRQEIKENRDLIRLATETQAQQVRSAIADIFEDDPTK